MRNIFLLISLFCLISCNSQKKDESKKNIVEYSCDCITSISDNNKSNEELIAETQKCISDSYEKYDEYVDDLANKYFDKNPDAQIEDAQNWIGKILTEKLVKNCPKYSTIVSKAAFQNRNSSDIIKDLASKICEEINSLNTDLSWDVIDPILMRQTVMNDQAIREKYNLDNKVEMNKYSTDLVQELVVNCEKYNKFTMSLKK